MSVLKYRPEIDGLRAIAVLSVVIFHLFPSVLPGGFAGVDVFFVISGYLITSIIARDINRQEFSFINFYARRARRIFPALIVVLVTVLVAGWFLLLPDEYAQLGLHTFAGALFTSNLLLWSEVGYFDLSSIEKPLLHLWSLGVEEQFYLVWPILLLTLSRFGLSLFKAVLMIGIASLAFSVWQTYYYPDSAFYSPISRCWQLSAGASLALWQMQRGSASLASKPMLNFIAFLGLVFLLLTIFVYSEELAWPAPLGFLPVLGAVFLLAISDSFVHRVVLSNRVFVFFGSISFALYLWHWPLLSLHQIVENSVHTDARWAILAVSVFLAYITTHFVEKPVRFKGELRHRAAVVTSLLLVVGLGGALVKSNDGFDQRGDQVMATLTRDLTGGVTLPASTTNWCHDIELNFCSHQGGSTTVALLGDSHARSLYFGLRDFLAQRNESLIVLGNGGCPPYIEAPYEAMKAECIHFFNTALKKLVDDDQIHTVFVTFYLARYFESIETMDYIFPNNGAVKKDDLLALNVAALRKTLAYISKSGKKIIFLKDVPTMPFNVRSCLPRSGKGDDWDASSCMADSESIENGASSVNKALDKLFAKMPDVSVIDLMEGICTENVCLGATEDRLLYLDDNHLSIYGSKYVIGALADKLSEVMVRASN